MTYNNYPKPAPSDITAETIYYRRREFLQVTLGLLTCTSVAGVLPAFGLEQTGATTTPEKTALGYNNYYEFSTNKEAVKHIASNFVTSPWQITISGLVEKNVTLNINDIIKLGEEERIYSMRCVEGWSMVLPWLGVNLAKLLALAKPLSSAKFVKFVGTLRPEEMIGQRQPTLEWPYTEALRIDEAMHPLTLLATGLYGKKLSAQNGAPIRLVVPWKYGFKSIKAIERIELVDVQPVTSWMQAASSEYGFYANVNPEVPHPRWSQRLEVRLGEIKKIPTKMFNGYAEQVADLYSTLDLHKNF